MWGTTQHFAPQGPRFYHNIPQNHTYQSNRIKIETNYIIIFVIVYVIGNRIGRNERIE